MTRLVIGMLRPYRGWLAIVFIAMLAEIATSLAAPWPLKLVLDDALGKHHLPHWLEWAHDYGFGRHTLGVALFAGVATLVIAVSVPSRPISTTITPQALGSGSPMICGFVFTSICIGFRCDSTTRRKPAR